MGERQDRLRRRGGQKNHLVYKRTEVGAEKSSGGNGFFYFASFMLVSSILYLIFMSGVFNVSEVKVMGTNEAQPDDIKGEIEKDLEGQFAKNNLLFFDASASSSRMKKEFGLKNIKIKKKYLDRVEVTVEEYVPSVQWFSDSKYYMLDERGRVVREEEQKKDAIPVVYDRKNLRVTVGKSLVTVEFINFIKYISDNFSSDKSGNVSRIEINESLNEIIVTSSKGFRVYFDTTYNPEEEIRNLTAVLNSKELKGRWSLTYIDLRIKNKAFFR